jgi:tetratricopeptide (TPR) repeat protein
VSERLYRLFYSDRKARAVMYGTSAGVSISVGTALLVFGSSVEQSVAATSALTLGIVIVSTIVYCARPPERLAQRPAIDSASVPRRFALAGGFLSLAIALGISTQRLEAGILDRRLLDGLKYDPDLSGKGARDVRAALDLAEKARVDLPMPTLLRLREVVRISALEKPPSADRRDAATAMARYGFVVGPQSGPNKPAPQTEADRAFARAEEHYLSAFKDPSGVVNFTEAFEAKTDLATAIDLAGEDKALQIKALMVRAATNVQTGGYDEALADAAKAEQLGALDLFDIASIEGAALVGRGRPQDLRRSVDLLTLGLRLEPPKPESIIDVAISRIGRFGMLGNRGLAYYALGNFEQAIEDCHAALALALALAPAKASTPEVARELSKAYKTVVLSYLQLDAVDKALAASSEWADRTRDPAAFRARQIVEDNRADPQRAVGEIISPR